MPDNVSVQEALELPWGQKWCFGTFDDLARQRRATNIEFRALFCVDDPAQHPAALWRTLHARSTVRTVRLMEGSGNTEGSRLVAVVGNQEPQVLEDRLQMIDLVEFWDAVFFVRGASRRHHEGSVPR